MKFILPIVLVATIIVISYLITDVIIYPMGEAIFGKHGNPANFTEKELQHGQKIHDNALEQYHNGLWIESEQDWVYKNCTQDDIVAYEKYLKYLMFNKFRYLIY